MKSSAKKIGFFGEASDSAQLEWEAAVEAAEGRRDEALACIRDAEEALSKGESGVSAEVVTIRRTFSGAYSGQIPRESDAEAVRQALVSMAAWEGTGRQGFPGQGGARLITRQSVSDANKEKECRLRKAASALGEAIYSLKEARSESNRCMAELKAASEAVDALRILGIDGLEGGPIELKKHIATAEADLQRLQDVTTAGSKEQKSISSELEALDVASLDVDYTMAETTIKKKSTKAALDQAIERHSELQSLFLRTKERQAELHSRIGKLDERLATLKGEQDCLLLAVYTHQLEEAERKFALLFDPKKGALSKRVAEVNDIRKKMNALPGRRDAKGALGVKLEFQGPVSDKYLERKLTFGWRF